MRSTAFILLTIGALLFAAGLALLLLDKVPWLGNLPGDIHYRGKHFSFHFPLMTCILASIILSLLISIIMRFLGK